MGRVLLRKSDCGGLLSKGGLYGVHLKDIPQVTDHFPKRIAAAGDIAFFWHEI